MTSASLQTVSSVLILHTPQQPLGAVSSATPWFLQTAGQRVIYTVNRVECKDSQILDLMNVNGNFHPLVPLL